MFLYMVDHKPLLMHIRLPIAVQPTATQQPKQHPHSHPPQQAAQQEVQPAAAVVNSSSLLWRGTAL
jgi:hypothetical protein